VPTRFERRALLLVLMVACGGEPRRTDSAHTSIDEILGGRAAGRPLHRVRVERDGTVLAAFGGSRAKAVLDGTHLSIELASEDGAHRLAIEIDGRSPDVYQLAPTFETAKAVILLVSHGLPGRISPSEGELQLAEAGDGFYSGSFTGRVTDENGYRYAFEGWFSTVPVVRL
jgi:hypothetical protein